MSSYTNILKEYYFWYSFFFQCSLQATLFLIGVFTIAFLTFLTSKQQKKGESSKEWG